VKITVGFTEFPFFLIKKMALLNGKTPKSYSRLSTVLQLLCPDFNFKAQTNIP
jgi:hypothetical protein